MLGSFANCLYFKLVNNETNATLVLLHVFNGLTKQDHMF